MRHRVTRIICIQAVFIWHIFVNGRLLIKDQCMCTGRVYVGGWTSVWVWVWYKTAVCNSTCDHEKEYRIVVSSNIKLSTSIIATWNKQDNKIVLRLSSGVFSGHLTLSFLYFKLSTIPISHYTRTLEHQNKMNCR